MSAEGEPEQQVSRLVLLALDRSQHSERAIRWFASKVYQATDLVVIVNISEPPEVALGFGVTGPAVAEVYTKAMDETVELAKKLAADTKELCRSIGIKNFRFIERISRSAGEAIVEIADEENVDFIVMGSRGQGVLRRTFMGSVSDYVLHHTHRAVLVIPPEK